MTHFLVHQVFIEFLNDLSCSYKSTYIFLLKAVFINSLPTFSKVPLCFLNTLQKSSCEVLRSLKNWTTTDKMRVNVKCLFFSGKYRNKSPYSLSTRVRELESAHLVESESPRMGPQRVQRGGERLRRVRSNWSRSTCTCYSSS